MAFLSNFFRKRKMKKREISADKQYLDALEIIKESMETYLELLARSNQDGNIEEANRLRTKLNSIFEYHNKSWNGEIKIIHTIVSHCSVDLNEKCLKLD